MTLTDKEFNLNLKFCRVWIHPEYSREYRSFGIRWDKSGNLEFNLIWFHIEFMYYR